MKKTIFAAVLAGLVSLQALAADYKIDTAHSSVNFNIKHLVSRVTGSFTDFAGTLNLDEKNPEKSTGKVTIQAKSINTNNKKRDDHLRSPDFFDVAKYPTITYTIKKVEKKSDDKYQLVGDLNMRGVTREEKFDVEYLGKTKGPQGDNRVGFTATSNVNRKNYGINWNKDLGTGFVLGDDAAITFQIEAAEQPAENAIAAENKAESKPAKADQKNK